jgi:hypothetical protein
MSFSNPPWVTFYKDKLATKAFVAYFIPSRAKLLIKELAALL